MISTFYIGSYTQMLAPDFGGTGKGIYTAQLNSKTGEVLLSHICKTINPSYLALSTDKKYVYALKEVPENENPVVKSYRIKEDSSLEFLNEQPVIGGLPCHIYFFKNKLFIACYGTGNVLVFSTGAEGKILSEIQNIQHTGSSINRERQEGPHPHQVVFCPQQKNVCIPDLGLDRIKWYVMNDEELTSHTEKDILLPEGGGARHMVFSSRGDFAYLINELTGMVSVLKRVDDHFVFQKSISSLPKSYTLQPSGSAIRIHPNGKYVYVGNRTIDIITIFEILENGDLNLLDYQYVNGKTLREFNITPDGKWLLACLQDSNELISYKIQTDGTLVEKSRNTNILSPVCVVFR